MHSFSRRFGVDVDEHKRNRSRIPAVPLGKGNTRPEQQRAQYQGILQRRKHTRKQLLLLVKKATRGSERRNDETSAQNDGSGSGRIRRGEAIDDIDFRASIHYQAKPSMY
jgi:hypothetical protein